MLDKDYRPRRPSVTSLTSANAEFERWYSQNVFRDPLDALGIPWLIKPNYQIFPDPVNRHASRHRLAYEVTTQVNRQLLLEKKVLDASKDQRLLELMDDSTITLIYQRAPIESDGLDKIRSQALVDLAKIRDGIARLNLGAFYRKWVGRSVSQRFSMSYPSLSTQQIKIDLEL